MKFRLLNLLILLFLSMGYAKSFAYPPADEEIPFAPRKFYMSNSFDGALFTTAFHTGQYPLNNGLATTVGTVRFTYFFNIGFNANYNFSNTVGIFSGLGIKNIGFIEKINVLDSTIKRRVYTIGAPLGIKIGDLKSKTYFFLGGGVDVPFNYREKGFVRKGNKDKFNEWFSDRTPLTMPYAFAGVSVKPGIYFKVQYYPSNFMNPDFEEVVPGGTTVIKPYNRYDIKLLMVSVGLDIRYSNKFRIKGNDTKNANNVM